MAPNHTPPTHAAHHAPFTDTQITQLAAWQRAAGTGALMCGAPRHEHVPLIPDRGGLRCSLSGCSYTQTWAPAHALETTPSSTGAVIEIEPGVAVINGHHVAPVQPTVHACPPDRSGIMPCCGRTPFEAASDQLAANPELVTCPGRPVPDRHCGEECFEGHVHAGRCTQPLRGDQIIEPTPPPDGQELAEARSQANGFHPLTSPAWQPGDGHARCGYISLNADSPHQCTFRAGHPPHGHTMSSSDPGAFEPGSPESILVALHKLHSRGPGQQRTPLGMVDADDVCITCHTPWPCPTGRILTQHTQETP